AAPVIRTVCFKRRSKRDSPPTCRDAERSEFQDAYFANASGKVTHCASGPRSRISLEKRGFVLLEFLLSLGIIVHATNIEPPASLLVAFHTTARVMNIEHEIGHIDALPARDVPHRLLA